MTDKTPAPDDDEPEAPAPWRAALATVAIYLAAAAIIIGAGAVVWIVAGPVLSLPVSSAPAVDPRAEYYRGLYDVCAWSGAEAGVDGKLVVARCNEFVATRVASDWYEAPSMGYATPEPPQLGVGE